jgi:hypothetical protein
MASAARAVGWGPQATAAFIASLFQLSPQSTGTPCLHSLSVSPKGWPSTISGMGCRRLVRSPFAALIALGWCMSTSASSTGRCFACAFIFAMWFRMTSVAWGPFRWAASRSKLGWFVSCWLLEVNCLLVPSLCHSLFRFFFMFSAAGVSNLTKFLILSASARTAWSCL